MREKFPILVKNNLDKIVTFGSPSIGEKSFHSYYDDLHSKTFRIVNGADIVPFTPPFWYRHVGNEIWFGKNKTINNIWWFKRLLQSLNFFELLNFSSDHSMDSYIERLSS